MVIGALFALDLSYNYAYNQNNNTRNKLQLALKTTNVDYDVVVLGTSRANNHIQTQQFQDININAYNFGMSGASLEDCYVLLKILLEKNKVDKVLIEIDLNINTESYSVVNRSSVLPFINTSSVINNYYKDKMESYFMYKNIPFYRYMVYDSQIGFREFFSNLIRKKSNNLNQFGYSPLLDSGQDFNYNISSFTPKKNKYYDLIKALCKEKNVHLISFTTPICKQALGSKDYFKNIESIYPEVINLEHVVVEDKYFSTCGHMNIYGAEIFTKYLIKRFF